MSDVHAGREIIRKGKLATRRCDVFDVPLAYFFVMRPAYLGRFAGEKTDFLDYSPVALILRPEAVPSPRHVYPFDTGAVAKGVFVDRANARVPLEDYELDNTHEAAAGFIGWAFGNVAAYLDGILRRDLPAELPPADSVGTAYVAIAKAGISGDPARDTRSSTLELTSADNVDLAGNVLLAIVPKQLLEFPGEFMTSLSALVRSGTEVCVYDWHAGRAPAEYQREVMRIAREWYGGTGVPV